MKAHQAKKIIEVDEFCLHNHVEMSFIRLLQQNGLLEFIMIEESLFIGADQLRQLEKMVRFYYELNINMEGIESITHLLNQINDLQNEMKTLKNKLQFYE